MRLQLKVVPGASRDGIAGWLGDALKIRVRVAPERGRANKAVESLLAKALDIPLGSVSIITGKTSPRKVAEIEGLSASEVQCRLGRTCKGRPS